MRQVLLLILILGALIGCEYPVDIDALGDHTPVLVANAQFNPDSLWAVHVSKSVAITADTIRANSLYVDNATVVVSGEAGFHDTLHFTASGLYRSRLAHRPVEGVLHSLTVAVPGFENLWASSQAPRLESRIVGITPTADDEGRYRIEFEVTDQRTKATSGFISLRLRQFAVMRTVHIESMMYPTPALAMRGYGLRAPKLPSRMECTT